MLMHAASIQCSSYLQDLFQWCSTLQCDLAWIECTVTACAGQCPNAKQHMVSKTTMQTYIGHVQTHAQERSVHTSASNWIECGLKVGQPCAQTLLTVSNVCQT